VLLLFFNLNHVPKGRNYMKRIVLAAAAISLFAVPAMAESNFYGSARLATFYNISDVGSPSDKNADVDEHLHGNSTLGANFSNGDIGGKVEYGGGAAVGLRLLYGTWNFGSGKLTIGQDYNSYYLGSAQVHGDDLAFKGYGALWDQRQAQIKVNLNNGVYFAAIQPSIGAGAAMGTGVAPGNPTVVAITNAQVPGIQIYLPKLNVGYAGKANNVAYNVGVVGQTYKNEAIDKDVLSVLGYVNGSAVFGATTLMANLSFAQNAGNMGFNGRMVYDTANKKDVTGFEGYLQLTQKISDTVSGNVGFGYVTDKSGASGAKADDKMAFFVNAPITLAKNVSVTPEFDYYDQLNKAGASENNKQYAVGAKWQISF
jgi:hypothetical protein